MKWHVTRWRDILKSVGCDGRVESIWAGGYSGHRYPRVKHLSNNFFINKK